MVAKLSPAQERALAAVRAKPGQSAHELGCLMTTLRSLRKRRLVKSMMQPGSTYSPKRNIHWYPVDQGQSAGG